MAEVLCQVRDNRQKEDLIVKQSKPRRPIFSRFDVSLMFLSRPYRPDDPDQQDRADEAGNQVADPSPQDDPEVAQNGAGNRRTDNAA